MKKTTTGIIAEAVMSAVQMAEFLTGDAKHDRVNGWAYDLELFCPETAAAFSGNEEGYSLWQVQSWDSVMPLGNGEIITLTKYEGRYVAYHYSSDNAEASILGRYEIEGPQVEWAARQQVEGIAAALYNSALTGGQA